MLENLSTYLEYKDSGHPSFGQIPKHWKLLRNGQIFSQRNQTGFPDLPILEVSLKTGVRVRNFENSKRKQVMSDREKYKRALNGDIAYNMMRMWQGAVGVAPVDGLVSPAYVVASPLSEVDSRYYSYLFRTQTYMNEVKKYSHGIVADRNRLYWDEFKQIPSLFPPSNEQKKISDFLDYYSRKVSRLVRIKKRQAELLRELKEAIITSAVTRGVNSEVRLKPSGVAWLGDIPEHWEPMRVKNCIDSVANGTWGEDPNEGNAVNHLICVRVADFDRDHLSVSKEKLTVRSVEKSKNLSRILKKGDLLIEKSGGGDKQPVGRVVLFNEDYVAVCSNFITKVSVDSELIKSEYLLLYLHALNLLRLTLPHITQTTGIQNLNEKSYFNTIIALPPLEEQQAIVKSINQKVDVLNKSIRSINKEIDLITEYHTSLISDVITGKIDVRDFAVDEIYEDELDPTDLDEELVDETEGVEDIEECEG
ncbi:restriction endonuclease subunit S (plasmid) [Niallia sp. XMNu-256]|uniref:restriction endonuclease subunit S n=1 Tax=Niallia sp. XMNu-256 TaxID=3082444 RepID=UPI0030D4A13D